MTPTTELAEKLEAIPTADMTLEDQKVFALGIDTLRKQAEEIAAKEKRLVGYESFEQYVWFLLDEERVKRRGPALIVDIIRHHPAMTDRLARSAYNEPKQNGEAK